MPADGGKVLKGLAVLAPCTFGIYLIHEHPLINRVLWSDWWPNLGISYDNPWLIPAAIGFSILVFLSCAGIDLLRQGLTKIISKITKKQTI